MVRSRAEKVGDGPEVCEIVRVETRFLRMGVMAASLRLWGSTGGEGGVDDCCDERREDWETYSLQQIRAVNTCSYCPSRSHPVCLRRCLKSF